MGGPSRIHIRTTTVHLYVNDITKVSNIFKINLFADDTSLIHTHDNFEYLINYDIYLVSNKQISSQHNQNKLHDFLHQEANLIIRTSPI